MAIRKGELEYKLVIVVRDDLKMSGGKLAVQVAHAAVSCSLQAKAKHAEWFKSWYNEGQKKVVVRAKTIEDLHELANKAQRAGLPRSLITDAGLTELPPNTTTCLGVGPGPDNLVDTVTGSLPLA